MAKGMWPPPGYPLVEGDHMVTNTWTIHLPEKFARRIEDGSLVLWRPGLTIWLDVWNNNDDETQDNRLKEIKQTASPNRYAEEESKAGGVTRFSYRLRDVNDEGAVEAVFGFAIADSEQFELAVYFDEPAEEVLARQLVNSVRVAQIP